MQLKSVLFLALLPLSTVACLEDGQPDGDNTELGSTSQDLDNCTTGGALNDDLTVYSSVGDKDSYTRPGSTTCANYQTKVLVHMTAAPKYPAQPSCIAANSINVSVASGDWRIQGDGMTDDKTECENSTLTMSVTDQNGHPVPVEPSSGVVHPQWKGDHCGGVQMWAANATGLSQGAGEYTVKVKAVRGLEQYHHGYARHTIEAEHDDSFTCQ
jgi:hypothetical protein